MLILITGLRGTLAPHLARAARDAGHEVMAWDRSQVPPDDAGAGSQWLDQTRPDAIAHLAMGGEDWAALLARYAAERGLPMVFTSTAMVFHHEPDGPHAPHDARTAQDEYGRYKIRCEDAVRSAHPGAAIARIGWQIDERATGNNMLAALDEWQRRDGRVAASRRWRPACSFMADTAAALLALLTAGQSGIVHLDSNSEQGHTFDAIAHALAQRFGRALWRIEAHDDYLHDQRLVCGPVVLPPLSARLPLP
jgi:dTDP-4-dehydrorhamnose reductase